MMSDDESPTDLYFTSPEDIKGKVKPPIDEDGVVEYDMDESPPSSRPCSMKVEYVLSNSNQESIQHDIESEVQHYRPKRQVIQDEYDEELYCLARTVEDGGAVVRIDENHAGKGSNVWLSKRNILICVLILLFIIGGVATYFGLTKTGISLKSICTKSKY